MKTDTIMKIDTINIQTNNGTLFGNVINNYPQQPSSQPTPQPKDIEEAEVVPDVKIPSFFRTNAQSITKIQAKWKEALGNTTKTGVIRFVKSHDSSTGYFKLAGYTNEQLAEAFNEAQDKFVFTASDFENANKPLKK
jgi:hypothetical protein